MKFHLILISLTVLIFIITTPMAQALFGHVAAEKERRIDAEQKLTTQEQHNDRLQTTIHVLSVGVVVCLIIGAAVGSKTRRDARKYHPQR